MCPTLGFISNPFPDFSTNRLTDPIIDPFTAPSDDGRPMCLTLGFFADRMAGVPSQLEGGNTGRLQ